MVRYHNFDVVFAEIPGETTLAINITNCPNRCPGCHSPHPTADATGGYSGRDELPEGIDTAAFDYIKLGGWVEERGPLTAPTTNQRLYKVGPDGGMEDITERFRHKP